MVPDNDSFRRQMESAGAPVARRPRVAGSEGWVWRDPAFAWSVRLASSVPYCLACNDGLIRYGFVGVAGQHDPADDSAFRVANGDSNACPAEMRSPAAHELDPEITVLNSLPPICPLSSPLRGPTPTGASRRQF